MSFAANEVRLVAQVHAFGVAFSPDGKRLASGSEDQSVKLWDAQQNLWGEYDEAVTSLHGSLEITNRDMSMWKRRMGN